MKVAFIKTKLAIIKTKLAFIVYNRDKRSFPIIVWKLSINTSSANYR